MNGTLVNSPFEPPLYWGKMVNRSRFSRILNRSSNSILTPSDNRTALSETPRLARHIDPLTSLRFFAAFAIVVYHFNIAYPLNWLAPIGTSALDQGVSFFFVLSGFILYYCYPEIRSRRHAAEFLIARISRIWPAHLAAIALLLVSLKTEFWQPVRATVPWISIANALLLQAWIPQSKVYFSLNAPSWSVSDEWFFYLAYPFLITNWVQTWKAKLIASVSVTALLVLICAGLQSHGTHTPIQEVFRGLLYINPLARLAEFVLGMVTALAFTKMKTSSFSNTILSWTQMLIVALIVSNMYCVSFLSRFYPNAELDPLFNWFQHAGGAPLYAALIFAVAFQNGILGIVLKNRALVLLGEISYSIYLVHWVILQFFTARNIGAGLSNSNLFFLYAAAVCIVAGLMYALIEVPSRKLLRRWFLLPLRRESKNVPEVHLASRQEIIS